MQKLISNTLRENEVDPKPHPSNTELCFPKSYKRQKVNKNVSVVSKEASIPRSAFANTMNKHNTYSSCQRPPSGGYVWFGRIKKQTNYIKFNNNVIKTADYIKPQMRDI